MSTSSGGCLGELRFMIQSLTAGMQSSNALGEVMRSTQAATTSAITNMGTDVKRVVANDDVIETKVDVIEEEVGMTKKLLEKTTSRVEKVEDAMQEHAKKIQQMDRWRKIVQR